MPANYHQPDADVIIVGAGISGMITAYVLVEKEPTLQILILESRDRLGGRTFSNPYLNINEEFVVCDIGGQWLSSQHQLLFKLLDQLNINIKKSHFQKGKVIIDYNKTIYKQKKENAFDFCTAVDKLQLASFIQKIENLCSKDSLNEELKVMNMEQFINNNVSSKTARAIIKSMIFSYCGVEPSHVSVEFYIFFCTSTHGIVNQLITTTNGLREFWIQEGPEEICNKIAEFLHNDVVIVKNREVVAIKDLDSQLSEVKTANGHKYYCSNVVVAISASLVPKIKFTPPLPDLKSDILNYLIIKGSLKKFEATYNQAFWQKNGYSGDVFVMNGYEPTRPLLCCFDVTVGNYPTLTGYMVENGSDSALLNQLSLYFGQEVSLPLKFLSKQWPDGTPINCFRSYQDLCEFRSRNGRIFWASTETALVWYGTIEGAIYAGHRAAREVLYDIRPGSLTIDDMAFFTLNLEKVKKRAKVSETIYKKFLNRYYQGGALILLLILFQMWRSGTYSRLKYIFIKM